MARVPKDVTDAELAVLRVLWSESPLSVREIADRLYPRGGASDAATVQKLLERLGEKRCVRRSRTRPYRFRAIVDRGELIGRRLRDTAESLCDGSWTPLLTQLVRSQPLSAEDRRELLRLIEEAAEPTDESPREDER